MGHGMLEQSASLIYDLTTITELLEWLNCCKCGRPYINADKIPELAARIKKFFALAIAGSLDPKFEQVWRHFLSQGVGLVEATSSLGLVVIAEVTKNPEITASFEEEEVLLGRLISYIRLIERVVAGSDLGDLTGDERMLLDELILFSVNASKILGGKLNSLRAADY